MERKWICQSAKCGVTYEGMARVCPQCGSKAALASIMRTRGAVALVAGLFLVGTMSALGVMLGPQLLSPGEQIGGASFQGSSSDGLVILWLFAALWLFGLSATGLGLGMLVRGRRNRNLFALMMLMLVVIVAIVGLILSGEVL
ncbi:MAG: hypothetical protein AB7F98_06050 [Novosphingobium sp.]